MRIAFYSGLLIATTTTVLAQDKDPVWLHLQKRYDANGNGKISAAEHGRGEQQFKNLDKNGDGHIDVADFSRAASRGEFGRGSRGNAPDRPETQRRNQTRDALAIYGSFLNTDGKPGLSQEDWAAMRARLVIDEDGFVVTKSLAALAGADGKTRMARMSGDRFRRALDFDRDGEIAVTELDKVFQLLDTNGDGTLQAGSELQLPPGVGELAPDFTLPHAEDADRSVTLSSYRGKKPVALIFGSYT